jgi:hypothetical protein
MITGPRQIGSGPPGSRSRHLGTNRRAPFVQGVRLLPSVLFGSGAESGEPAHVLPAPGKTGATQSQDGGPSRNDDGDAHNS